MKYIKTYENLNNEPEIGDYVLMYYDPDAGGNKKLRIYLNNNVGEIVDYESEDEIVTIRYENYPEELVYLLHDHTAYNNGVVIRSLSSKFIRDFSKNKKDLEHYIASNKYNL